MYVGKKPNLQLSSFVQWTVKEVGLARELLYD